MSRLLPCILAATIILTVVNWVVMVYQLGVLGTPNLLGVLQAVWQTDQGPIHLAQMIIEMTLIVIITTATIGLYWLRRWAWTLAMLVLGVGLAVNLINFLRGDPAYALMLVRVIAVILLDQEPVRFAFGHKVGAYE